MHTIENKVIARIYGKSRGWVFTPSHMLDIAGRDAIDKSLERLTNRGIIRRLARGLYDYPRKHPNLGDLPPDYDQIARALAGTGNLKLQPSGAYAANLLGLTDQVPARIVYLTDGANRTVIVGNQQIVLKHTTPKNMATAGLISGLVIQALRHLGKDHVDGRIIQKLDRRLSPEDKQRLIRDIRYVPAWIGDIFRKLNRDDKS